MKFVVSSAFSDPGHYLALARAADAAGFESLALSDHVVHPKTLRTPYPYTETGQPRWEPFTPWPDPWVAIGAMAAVTERLRFVTHVYVLALRNPFLVAKALATAAVLSDDRVALGIGVGWMREEFELMEQPFAQRGARTDEMIDLLRTLWRGGMVEHHGRFYDFEPLEMSPVPRGPIPMFAGGLSEPALRRAAQRCDGWVSDLHSTEDLRGYTERLAALRADSDRAGKPFQVFAAANDAFDASGYQRMADAGVTHAITMPWIFYGGTTNSIEAKCDGIRRFGDEVIAKFGGT